MNKNKKKIITVDVEDVSPYSIATNLADVKAFFDSLLEKYGPDARIEWDPNFHYDYDVNPTPRFYVQVRREENDEEFQKRSEIEDKYRIEQERRDLAEFERLQRVFGQKK